MPRVEKDSFKFSFFPRTISEWSSLPKDIVNATSLDSFKSMLTSSLNINNISNISMH